MLRVAGGLIVAAALLAPHAPAGAAESYPSRPVRIVIPSGAGGITDILGRVIAPKLTEIGSAGTVVPHVKTGRIRALGVGAKQRIAVLPDVPPIADALPGYEARGWNGILAPAGTPRPIIDRLHGEIVKVVRSPEFGQVLTGEGATAVGNTPTEFDAIIRADVKKWARIVKEAGIRAE